MCEVVYEVPKAGMSYEGFVTILLTVVLVVLAVLTIIVAIVAIVGWAGFKDHVKSTVKELVSPAMEEKLKEYPDAAKYIELLQRIEGHLFFLGSVQSQIVSPPASKSVAASSNTAVQEEKAKPVPVPQPVTPIEQYPGEEQPNANPESAPPADDAPNAGPGHS